jgi:type II secretory pathway predicted ATPase ExeA
MYNSYFGFSQSPFENNLDQRFLFLGEDHQEVLEALLYFIETKKSFAMVCGDVGTGKTMLINSLLDRLPETVKPIIISNPYVNSQDLLGYLAKKLEIKTTGTENILELTDQVKMALVGAKAHNNHLVLIIDEAHLLSDQPLEEIRLLSNLETSDQKLLQILLVGQNELSSKLDRPEMRHLRQRINVNRFLSPLNYAETIQYIDHRLRQVGSSFASVFEKTCKGLIFKLTKGVPRQINQLCDNALLITMTEGQRQVNRQALKTAEEAIQTDRILTAKAWRGKAGSLFGRSGKLWVPLGVGAVLVLLGIISVLLGFWPGKPRLLPQFNKTLEHHWVETIPNPMLPEIKAELTPKTTPEPVIPKATELPHSKPLISPDQKSPENQAPDFEKGPLGVKPSGLYQKEPLGPVREEVNQTDPLSVAENPQSAPLSLPRVIPQEGETLTRIAHRQYQEDQRLGLVAIILQNPDVTNEDIIQAGEALYLPKINFKNQTIQLKDHYFYALYGRYTSTESLKKAVAGLTVKKIKFIIRDSTNRSGNLIQRIFLGGYGAAADLEKALASLKTE